MQTHGRVPATIEHRTGSLEGGDVTTTDSPSCAPIQAACARQSSRTPQHLPPGPPSEVGLTERLTLAGTVRQVIAEDADAACKRDRRGRRSCRIPPGTGTPRPPMARGGRDGHSPATRLLRLRATATSVRCRTRPSRDSRDGGTGRSFSWPAVRPAVRPAHLCSSVPRWKSSHASSAWRSPRMSPGPVRSTGGAVHASVMTATVVVTAHLRRSHSRRGRAHLPAGRQAVPA